MKNRNRKKIESCKKTKRQIDRRMNLKYKKEKLTENRL